MTSPFGHEAVGGDPSVQQDSGLNPPLGHCLQRVSWLAGSVYRDSHPRSQSHSQREGRPPMLTARPNVTDPTSMSPQGRHGHEGRGRLGLTVRSLVWPYVRSSDFPSCRGKRFKVLHTRLGPSPKPPRPFTPPPPSSEGLLCHLTSARLLPCGDVSTRAPSVGRRAVGGGGGRCVHGARPACLSLSQATHCISINTREPGTAMSPFTHGEPSQTGRATRPRSPGP